MALEDFEARLEEIGPVDDGSEDNVEDNVDEDGQNEDAGEERPASMDSSVGGETDTPKRVSILSKITGILNGKKAEDSTDADDNGNADHEDEESQDGAGDADGNDDSAAQDDDTKKPDEVFVDPRFMIVAREYGWTDAQVIDFSSKNTAVEQVQLANHMEEALGEDEGSEDEPKHDTAVVSEDLLAQLSEDEDNKELIDKLVRPLLGQVQELSSALAGVQNNQGAQDEQQTQMALKQDFELANAEFDRHAEEFEGLGKTDSLKRLPGGAMDMSDPAVQRRSEVFDDARMYRTAHPNSTWKECLDHGMVVYRGRHGEEAMEKRILTKLKKSAKNVSPKSRGVGKTTKFTNPQDRKRAVINAALERHGTQMR